jgi:uncharacterized membrane protein
VFPVSSPRIKILPRRFAAFLVIFAVASLALWRGPVPIAASQALLAGFDLAAIAFIASLWPLSRDHSAAQIRRHAIENDANRFGVLVITSLVMLVITTALFIAIPAARNATGAARITHLLLVLGSLIVAWGFSNLVYALHYAHMYFGGTQGGLCFPNQADPHRCPDFWDFAYFSTTIGMAFATSDVEITEPAIRRVATIHGIAAFFYNLIVLAFTINVTAGG